MVPSWLLSDNNMYDWIVKIIYLHITYPDNVPKVREYRLDFGAGDRYVVEISINKKDYTCILWLNNKTILKFEFDDPIDFIGNSHRFR